MAMAGVVVALRTANLSISLFVWVVCLVLGQQSAWAQLRYVTEAENGRTIVFIHGFMGDPMRTFSAGPPHKSWPEIMREDKEVLGSALPMANYSTAMLRYPADLGGSMNVTELADNMLTLLNQSKLGFNTDRIVFVTHSLGGLLLKQMLARDSQGDVRWGRRVDAIFLMASPADGSQMANLVTNLTGWLGPLVDDLRTVNNNRWLFELQRQWQTYREDNPVGKKIPVFCGYETIAYAGVVWVPFDKADRDCRNKAFAFEADHSSIVKPTSVEDMVYHWVRGSLAVLSRDANEPVLVAEPKVVQRAPAATKAGVVVGPPKQVSGSVLSR